ncbi:NfeD family protein [Asticcacaulis sp. BYS171W]|uniref:NfeD family protein n=1 Tax=Asticcacaulis aquaticus TaxID=2984212 RepID=A0ABT5HNM3_9CAUL|nr:NfeD family protein [Asticcacaulis aquaticus]MDC7681660.1 NfeD family protein [Asticcacaulis aquaticus]
MELLFAPTVGFQAFWIWLAIGGVILGIEALVGTQWLLWPATGAGIVAVLTLTGLPVNLLVQIVIFCVLTTAMTLLSRKFMKPVEVVVDINDPNGRLIGKEALVIEAFDDRDGSLSTGRVIYEGVEWPAVYERGGATRPILPAEKVEILKVAEGKLIVKPA